MYWDRSLHLVVQFSSEGCEGVCAFVLSAGDLREFKELEISCEVLDELYVSIHSIISDIVVAEILAYYELGITIRADSLGFNCFSETEARDEGLVFGFIV